MVKDEVSFSSNVGPSIVVSTSMCTINTGLPFNLVLFLEDPISDFL